MRRIAATLTALTLAVAALAGCGGSKSSEPPPFAYLTGVHVEGNSISFEFKSAPQQIRTRYEPASHLAECGSGNPVRLRGTAFVVVHFQPAASAELKGEEVVPTYTGPKRLQGTGPVLETAKSCDFEADLGWAVGLERRLPVDVSRDGSTVTVSFG
jgi:hypothetical protein